jgi:hypothetical protein
MVFKPIIPIIRDEKACTDMSDLHPNFPVKNARD